MYPGDRWAGPTGERTDFADREQRSRFFEERLAEGLYGRGRRFHRQAESEGASGEVCELLLWEAGPPVGTRRSQRPRKGFLTVRLGLEATGAGVEELRKRVQLAAPGGEAARWFTEKSKGFGVSLRPAAWRAYAVVYVDAASGLTLSDCEDAWREVVGPRPWAGATEEARDRFRRDILLYGLASLRDPKAYGPASRESLPSHSANRVVLTRDLQAFALEHGLALLWTGGNYMREQRRAYGMTILSDLALLVCVQADALSALSERYADGLYSALPPEELRDCAASYDDVVGHFWTTHLTKWDDGARLLPVLQEQAGLGSPYGSVRRDFADVHRRLQDDAARRLARLVAVFAILALVIATLLGLVEISLASLHGRGNIVVRLDAADLATPQVWATGAVALALGLIGILVYRRRPES